MLVLCLTNLTVLVLFSRLGILKVLHSFKSMQGVGLNLCLKSVRDNLVLCCHLFTGTSSGTGGNPCFRWPHSRRWKSKNHHSTISRFLPHLLFTHVSTSAQSRNKSLGNWLDSCCDADVPSTWWHLQRPGACQLWCQYSSGFGHGGLAQRNSCWMCVKLHTAHCILSVFVYHRWSSFEL